MKKDKKIELNLDYCYAPTIGCTFFEDLREEERIPYTLSGSCGLEAIIMGSQIENKSVKGDTKEQKIVKKVVQKGKRKKKKNKK